MHFTVAPRGTIPLFSHESRRIKTMTMMMATIPAVHASTSPRPAVKATSARRTTTATSLPVTVEEDEACSDLYECSEGHVCNKGKCVEYFSVAEGAAADSNIACRSAIVSSGVCQPKQATAVDSTDDDDDNDDDDDDEDFDGLKGCTSNADCTASDGVTTGTCVVGIIYMEMHISHRIGG